MYRGENKQDGGLIMNEEGRLFLSRGRGQGCFPEKVVFKQDSKREQKADM